MATAVETLNTYNCQLRAGNKKKRINTALKAEAFYMQERGGVRSKQSAQSQESSPDRPPNPTKPSSRSAPPPLTLTYD